MKPISIEELRPLLSPQSILGFYSLYGLRAAKWLVSIQAAQVINGHRSCCGIGAAIRHLRGPETESKNSEALLALLPHDGGGKIEREIREFMWDFDAGLDGQRRDSVGGQTGLACMVIK